MKTLLAALALAALGTAPAAAAGPCKDAKGKFVKCPEKPAATTRCKDAKGKFVKCGSPGAKPA